MEFKVGDTVKILDRVGDGSSYYPLYSNAMLKYAGTLTTIKEVHSTGSLMLNNSNFYWDQKAVKLVNEDKYLHPSELKVSSANLINETSIGTVEIPQECLLSDCVGAIAVYPHWKNYNILWDKIKEKPKEELNLFPTKKHYQLNFNY